MQVHLYGQPHYGYGPLLHSVRSKAIYGLTSKTFSGVVFDAADATLPAVPSGQMINQLILYKDTRTESTSKLIWRIDGYTGIPVTGTGADLALAWAK